MENDRGISRRSLVSGALGASSLLMGYAGPARASTKKTLRIAVGQAISSIDPHFHAQASNMALAREIFGALVLQDEALKFEPGLALAWRTVDDLTWEFDLRPGVKFHDGSDFGAEDVVASFKRIPNVPNSPNSFVTYIRPIEDVSVVSPHRIRIKTRHPAPLLLNDLAQVFIVGKSQAASPTADFNSGKAAVGTGPYRFAEFMPGERIRLSRNPAYWGKAPVWEEVVLRLMPSAAARTAALLAGDADVVDQVQIADIARLKRTSSVSVVQTVGAFPVYLHLDQARDESPFVFDKTGARLAKNPLKDARVRAAISKAIDRKAIVARVLEGVGEAAGPLMPASLYAPTAGINVDAYDPDAARRLLAEAGYADGFGITFHAPAGRYPQGTEVAQAIAGMLGRVGIKTTVETPPWTTYVSQASAPNYNFSMMLFGWPSAMASPLEFLRGGVATPDPSRGYGPGNRGRYSNPRVDELIGSAFATIDTARRDEMTAQASRIVTEEHGVVMLYYVYNVWATQSKIKLLPRTDGYTLGSDVTTV